MNKLEVLTRYNDDKELKKILDYFYNKKCSSSVKGCTSDENVKLFITKAKTFDSTFLFTTCSKHIISDTANELWEDFELSEKDIFYLRIKL